MTTDLEIEAAVARSYDEPCRYETVHLRHCGSDEVLVRIEAAGVCHTDIRALHAGSMPPAKLPAVLGHEGAGVVVAVGTDVVDLAPGDHVCLTYASCGCCPACLCSAPANCVALQGLNFLVGPLAPGTSPLRDAAGSVIHQWFGQSSFATHAVVKARSAVRIPEQVPWAVAAPLGCSVQTGAGTVLAALGVVEDSSLIVFGCGGVGLAAVMAGAVAHGARVVAVDTNQARLELALELGATEAVEAGGPAWDRLRSMPSFDYAVDTTGVEDVMLAAVEVLRPGGVAGLVATAGARAPVLPPMSLSRRTVRGVVEGGVDPQRFIPTLVELWLDGRLPIERTVTMFDFHDLAAAMSASRDGTAVKPVLKVGER